MQPIIVPFTPNNLGRVIFEAQVMTGDRKSFNDVEFKLDSGSDFTTISCDDLAILGYECDFLESCPFHNTQVSTASGDLILPLRYISDVSIKFDNRETLLRL